MQIMLLLTAQQAAMVRGPSAVDPTAMLSPVALDDGRFALPASVLDDPAHEAHHEMLGSLPLASVSETVRPRPQSVGIIGAGFTGTMLAVHLIEMSSAPLKVILFDKAASFAKGQAYSTPNAKHLLNVRAANMSAYHSDPDHFLRWLANDQRHQADPSSREAFASRRTYGRYLRATLEAACLSARSGAHIVEVETQVAELTISEGSLEAVAADGRRFPVDCVALCIGNLPQALPVQSDMALDQLERYIATPWIPHVLDGIGPRDTVALIGTGLTMVDVVLDLRSRGHQGKITALSRRGLLPAPHRNIGAYPPFLPTDCLPKTISELFGVIRQEVRKAANRGTDWRSVIDALRSQTDSLWRNLPFSERKRFMRHVRPYWEVHRHRMAPAVADEIEALRRSGSLSVIAGKVASLTAAPRGITLTIRRRQDGGMRDLGVDWLVNCSGPQLDYDLIRDPLVRSLFASGLARPDALKLGLQVSDDYRLVGRDGASADALYALGPPIRGALWETTAVPDIRKQCEAVARQITRQHLATHETFGPAVPASGATFSHGKIGIVS